MAPCRSRLPPRSRPGAARPRLQPGPGDLRGHRAHARGHQADGGGVLRQRRRRPDARAAGPADGAGALAVRRPAGDQARHRPAGGEGRRVLPEAGPQGRSRLPRERRGHLPVRPDRRRDLPDRDRGAGLVRAHGHAHLPPLAGTPRRRRPPRRAADRPRPAARYVVHRRRPRRGRRPGAARGARHRRVPEDLGQPRHPHLRPDRAALGVHRPAARRDRLRPRARPPRRGRDDGLVEGGARRADLRRLQPEQPRPHHRLGLLPAPDPRRPGLHADDLGRARRRHRPARTTTSSPSPTGSPTATRGRRSTTRRTRSSRCCGSGRSCPAAR